MAALSKNGTEVFRIKVCIDAETKHFKFLSIRSTGAILSKSTYETHSGTWKKVRNAKKGMDFELEKKRILAFYVARGATVEVM